MHKKLLGLAIAIMLLFTALPFNAVMAQETVTDPADKYFVEFVQENSDYQGSLSYTYKPLYNEDLQAHGREYTFTVGEVSGYALMIELNGANQTFYEIEELFYDAVSPFANCDGLPVYVNHRVYLEYKNQGFYDALSGAAVNEELVAEQAERGFAYNGSNGLTDYTQTVTSYSTKNTEKYSINRDLPDYCGVTGSSSCAAVAGVIIIAYYDREYENLIPNCQVYTDFYGVKIYRSQPVEVSNLISSLNDLMLIGAEHDGRTFTEYQQGMSAYITGKGFTYTTTSVFTNGSFDFTKYKNAVENNIPVAIFCSTFAFMYNTTESNGVDTINGGYNDIGHVMVGCGYRLDKYYDANGNLIDKRTYLRVASGVATVGIGYLNINGVGTMDRAIATTIS